MERTDEQLIAASIAGDEQALSRLIERHTKLAYRFIFRLTGNAQDAEDLTQETFLKVWKNLSKYKPEHTFVSWLLRIARNTTIDFLRKKKSIVFSAFEDDEGENALADSLTDPGPLPDELAAQASDTQLLESLLHTLSATHREILILHYREHMTFNEIVRALDKPLDTVKSQHRRALIAMRAELEKRSTKPNLT